MGFSDLAFMEKQEDLIFIGSPGVGRTHLAVGIGMAACQQGKRTLFTVMNYSCASNQRTRRAH